MSDTTPAPGSRLTVEDAGSTTDPADLVDGDASTAGTTGTAPSTGADDLPSAPGATTSGLSSLVADDDSIGHVFDQTNGVVEGIDGDSDGTAESDERSAAERADEDPAFEAFADTETPRADDTDDPRVTGN
ncbi:hypothetical protein [Amnibacterium kyonggiense]|uniref:Uncharacterized protein n=1 Tax=Amnibacterium kyonggiense TaxID=595671 RepID=A0A4R7FP81_9MICO|nr:hypothetical protein [Amnibacterium kyonggiense]TDS79541.1 hypothetical protein CLV52_0072 [Amnibacterium kyonggiense]